MKPARWKYTLAALALAGLMGVTALPARAQTVITGPGMVTTNDGTLRFNGTIVAVGPDVVAMRVDGSVVRIPMALARFSVGGVDTDPTRLSPGLPVTASLGSVRGTITAMNGGALSIRTASGLLQLPSFALASPSLAHTMVSFRDINGHVTSMPVETALDLQQRHMGALAFGVEPSSMVNVAIIPPGSGVATIVTPTRTSEVALSPYRIGGPAAFTGPMTSVSVATSTMPLVLSGRVSSIGASTIIVDANGNRVVIPSSLDAAYTVNGAPTAWNDLSVGSTVSVAVPAGATIRSIDNGIVTYDLGGSTWRVPLAALPADYTAGTLVWMRGSNGQVLQVPLGSAVDLQRQGAVIVPARDYATPYDDRANSNMNDTHNHLDTNGNFDNPVEPGNLNH